MVSQKFAKEAGRVCSEQCDGMITEGRPDKVDHGPHVWASPKASLHFHLIMVLCEYIETTDRGKQRVFPGRV